MFMLVLTVVFVGAILLGFCLGGMASFIERDSRLSRAIVYAGLLSGAIMVVCATTLLLAMAASESNRVLFYAVAAYSLALFGVGSVTCSGFVLADTRAYRRANPLRK